MADTISVKPADLLIDAQNPRLPQPNAGQREAQQELAKHQNRKLVTLAKDIVDHGLNPTELLIVMPFEDDLNRYVALEGNRRIAALKALENPDAFDGVLDPSLMKTLRRLSVEYQNDPVTTIQCHVVKDREEARHWIELRHTGENDGAGIVGWGSDEQARYRARTSGLEFHSQALNFLEERGYLTPQDRREVPTASFKRLLGTPAVREKLGIEVKNGDLRLLGNEKAVARALMHVVQDLVTGKKRTQHIYTQEQRKAYAEELPAEIVVKPTVKPGHGAPLPSGGKVVAKPQPIPRRTRQRVRDVLIPRDCALSINDARVRDIERELRKISLEEFPNAAAVLFRVFVELSADAYIDARGLALTVDDTLRAKMEGVANDLLNRKVLSPQQASPVRRACQKDSFLAPSVRVMHDYVHNKHVFPAPGDLRASWDSLQPFFIAIWQP